jgi:hypothetical protein
MRKRIIGDESAAAGQSETGWLDLATLASAEISSEDPAHPLEAAISGEGQGWRAAAPGEQTIRLHFDQPQALKRVQLTFEEQGRERTQEFTLRWSADGAHFQEVLRQQYTFSPGGSTQQLETYNVDLHKVSALELRLKPNISGGPDLATLKQIRVG